MKRSSLVGQVSALMAVGLIALSSASALAQEPATQPASGSTRNLAEFGPINSPEAIKAAYEKAKAELGRTGGVLIVPAGAAKQFKFENTTQISPRTPEPPAETKNWKKAGPGFTVVELEPEGPVIHPPQVNGVTIDRTLRMPLNESLPHWSTDYALNIINTLIHGSNSYLDFLADDVKAGPDAKFYVRTIRGLRPGMFITAHGENGYGGGVSRLCIKTIGFDPARNLHYFTADTAIDHKANAYIHNKNNEGVIWMKQDTHCDEQTYDVMLNRNQYSLGDTYMYFARFRYMSNIHSAAGDENGNIFASYSESLSNCFTGTVEEVDWKNNTVKFAGSTAKNADTLGASRQLINMNPAKWITKGKVLIVPAESYWDTIDTGKFPFEGKTYPSKIANGGLRMGGLIRGDKDCPWDKSIIGRWIGITEKSELIAHSDGKIRWYQIDGLKENADGTKEITIQRFWWGAKSMGSPTLYRVENGTWDGHIRPLSYVIAPGTYVTEVSRAVAGPNGAGGERLLGVAPYCDMNTPADFAKGDAIEQAVGPDPFKPNPFRMWMIDNVPSVFPSPVFDLYNSGADARYTALWIRGGPGNRDGLEKTAEQRPAWDNVIVVDSCTESGINFKGDFTNAAILFQQPYHEQPIKWYYGQREQGKPFTAATLTVAKETGDLTFKGGDTRLSGSVLAKGLSGDETPARNLRGKNVAVKAGATSVEVAFPAAEADGEYAVFVEQTWLGARAITAQSEKGFTVTFDKPAPEGAKIHWMIVR